MEIIENCKSENSKIEIRKMILEDLENISDILYSDFDNFWSYDIFASELCCENYLYFISVKNNEILGFAGFKKICDEAEIMNIVIRKSARGLGIGSLLLEYLLSEAHNIGVNVVHLEVDSNNFIAIRLYEKFGFRRVGFRKGYYGVEGAILMEL